ncbi:hypothetical protein [Alicyclobacillus dauci]|uniref:Uncharacterized protein n=1 Tax=Alicyclobacillus dauci TaxID=1475485 RepID=A0ABY6Z3J5_9BACL|nr:hypothetical protein [Alicyclobacillus dauci]WAH36776.1 hypothetical protein NZD86_21805 [Alicyclobacillus dauci]
MVIVYVSIGLLALGIGLVFANLRQSMKRLGQQHNALRGENMRLHLQHMELQQYCYALEMRIQYLERSRSILSHIVKHANIRDKVRTDRSLEVQNQYIS